MESARSPFPDPEAFADPYPTYRRLRENTPVYWDDAEEWWLFTRHADVTAALRDDAFSAEVGTPSVDLLPDEYRELFQRLKTILSQLLLFAEPPTHTRIRQELQRAFTPRTVGRMGELLRENATSLVSACVEKDRIDVLNDFADVLAGVVFTETMGVDPAELPRLKEISDGLIGALGGHAQVERAERAERSVDNLTGVLRRHVGGPAEPKGVMAVLADALDAGRLTEDEAVAAFGQLLTGGLSPTPQTLAAGVLLLAGDPEQRAALERDPGLMPKAVEEILRYEPPFLLVHRIAVKDTTYGGQTIAAGRHVALLLGAANRDPAVFPEPDRFRIDRTPSRHVSFGVGHHFCLGGGLVRLATRTAMEAFLPHLPGTRLESAAPAYLPLMGIRALEAGPFLLT